MTRREFTHANNPSFACEESVLLLPFDRRSFLPAIVEACGGQEVPLDETTDRVVYRPAGAPRVRGRTRGGDAGAFRAR